MKGQYMLVIYDLDSDGKTKPVIASPRDMEVNWLRWKSDDRLLVSPYYADRRYGTATIETWLFALNPDGSAGGRHPAIPGDGGSPERAKLFAAVDGFVTQSLGTAEAIPGASPASAR